MGLCRFFCDHCIFCRYVAKKKNWLGRLVKKFESKHCPICRRAAKERKSAEQDDGAGENDARS